MNQAIFDKFYIISNDEVELDIEFSFRPPFDKLLEPIKDDIAQINKNKFSNRIGNALTKAKGHIQEFLECGLSDVDNPSNMSTYSNDGYYFRHKSLSMPFIMDLLMSIFSDMFPISILRTETNISGGYSNQLSVLVIRAENP